MLDYESIVYKAVTSKTDIDNTKQLYLDLLSKTVHTYEDDDMDWNALFQDFRPIVVREEYIARPDLISQVVYGTDKYADLICKLNGISNPFELNEDMVLLVPGVDKIESMLIKTGQACEKISEEDNSSTTTENIASPDRGNRKLLNEKRSPNEATVNDINYIIKKDLGLVFY